jgi:hypothetical protein
MKVATRDRGEIMHFAGFHELSPALRGGAPAFVTGHDETATRCGWEPFFRAMGERKLALVYDEEAPGAHEFRPEDEVRQLRHEHASLGDAIRHAKRFWRALFPGSRSQARTLDAGGSS